MNERIGVTVLSGYLGSGKTTLLNHLLTSKHGERIAVLVNDMSEVNIDGKLIKQGGFTRTDERLVEMQNGCICCTLREDLLLEVKKLAEEGEIDHILIESSGISEPVPVAQTFTYLDEETGIDLAAICKINAMVTVVDANRFWHDYGSGETLVDRHIGRDDHDDREIADLLIDQIEFANIIILNKIDLVPAHSVFELQQVLKRLNPDAAIHPTRFSKLSLEHIWNKNVFNLDEASQAAGWIKELQEEHIPETEEYGISSIVYKKARPFHPERFMKWLENWPSVIVRAKGFFWLATRNDEIGLLSQAGSSVSIQGAGEWIACLPDKERKAVMAGEPEVQGSWDETWGDRQTELVFIGLNMDKQAIQSGLDDCLLTDQEMRGDWQTFQDPLPLYT